MRKWKIRPPKVAMDFTDLNLTAYGGSSILARTARQHGLFDLLDEAVRVKVRNHGATDAETLWAMIAGLARGWDYSISLTNDTWRKPVPEQIEGLPDGAWTDIGMDEEATFATHRPAGWDAGQHYVVVRRRAENGQGLLVPHRTVILVSRDDLPLADLVGRHRGKQGPALTGRLENAFKGPLTDLDLHHPPCR